MRWRRATAVCTGAALLLTACAVPHTKGHQTIDKVAAGGAETQQIFQRYRSVRNTAIGLLDAKPLSTVESGAVLAIDSGSFEVSQKLAQTQKKDTSALDVLDVASPRLSKYPLWFMAQVKDPAQGVVDVQVFSRATSVDPWLLVASPEILADTQLPSLAHGARGTIVAVKPSSSTGLPMSPQKAANTYAEALDDPSSSAVKQVVDDAFIRQMRSTAATNSALKGVKYSQAWAADTVSFAARTADGGALVWATLLRQDTYTVASGLQITWPAGSPQEALLGQGISGTGKLNYYHQVLLYVPPDGGGKPRALGQYGGVIGVDK